MSGARRSSRRASTQADSGATASVVRQSSAELLCEEAEAVPTPDAGKAGAAGGARKAGAVQAARSHDKADAAMAAAAPDRRAAAPSAACSSSVRKKNAKSTRHNAHDKDAAEDLYEWEEVIGSRKNGEELLVKWKGWPPADATWEPADQLPAELIEHYHKRHGMAWAISAEAREPAAAAAAAAAAAVVERVSAASSASAAGAMTEQVAVVVAEVVAEELEDVHGSSSDIATSDVSSDEDGSSSSSSDEEEAAPLAEPLPPRRRRTPAHYVAEHKSPARLSMDELKSQLAGMGFSAEQVAAALTWTARNPKANTDAILEHVLLAAEPAGARSGSIPPGSAAKVKRRKSAAPSSASKVPVDGPVGAVSKAEALHKTIKTQCQKIRREEGLIEAYNGERAQARAADNGGLVVPQAELQRATLRVLTCKRNVRSNLRELREMQTGSCFHQLEAAALETEEDGDGIDVKDIICSVCRSGDDHVGTQQDVDILLCDAPSCRLAFHNVEPCLGKHAVPGEALTAMLDPDDPDHETEWWCPLCTVMYDAVDLINESFERAYTPDLSRWGEIFSEVADGGAGTARRQPGGAAAAAAASGMKGNTHTATVEDGGEDAGYCSDADDDFDGGDADDEEENSDGDEEGEKEVGNITELSEEALRKYLGERGLSTSGKRAMLVKRLEKAAASKPVKGFKKKGKQSKKVSVDLTAEDDVELEDSDVELDDDDESQPVVSPQVGEAAQVEDEDIELDDSDGDDEEGATGGGSDSTEAAASPSPRGRGKRRRQGIDYTCLDYMLFGLPEDVPREDMERSLSLAPKRKRPAKPEPEQVADAKVGKKRAGSKAKAAQTKKKKQKQKKRKGDEEDDGSSLALLLGDGASEDEDDWSPGAKKRSRGRSSSSAAAAAEESSDDDDDDGDVGIGQLVS